MLVEKIKTFKKKNQNKKNKTLNFILAFVTPRIFMGFLKKIQPIRSSRLAIFKPNIYIYIYVYWRSNLLYRREIVELCT